MRRKMPPLNPLRVFEAAARHCSFTLAAGELNITQGAVSRQIRTLEEYLDFELFERTSRGVELIDSARTFGAALTRAFEQVTRATEDLIASRGRAVLCIRAYTTFLTHWLIPRLADFKHAYPNIDLRLVSAGEHVDFESDDVDIGIRYGNGRWPELVSDLLFSDELLPVCSPKMLEKGLPLREPRDLLNYPLLHHVRRSADWPGWLRAAKVEEAELARSENLYIEDLAVLYESAIAGFGIAIGQRAYLAEALQTGRLVVPFDIALRRSAGYYLVSPRRDAAMEKICIFRRWLLASLTEQPEAEGTKVIAGATISSSRPAATTPRIAVRG